MIRPIMKDIFFLNQRSEPATEADKQVAVDLLDTLKAHEEGCVGMAANMIGVKKCIIAVNMGFMNVAMFNPKIVKRSGKYETEEGCLSLTGVRKCTRYQEIEGDYCRDACGNERRSACERTYNSGGTRNGIYF